MRTVFHDPRHRSATIPYIILPKARRVMLIAIFSFVISFATLLPTAVHASTGAISQSYKTNDTDLTPGTLISLASKGATVVTAANTNNVSNLVGIAASKPLIELSDGTQNSLQVVVSGSTDALVTDLNGTIKIGDKITASPISGIGMKAINPSEVVGTAQADLDSVSTVTKTFVGIDGKGVSAKVGLLPVAVNIGYYSASSGTGGASALVPPFLQNLANTIAGKVVSPLRVLIGLLALLLGFATITIMLYTGIRSGVISLGRNPLAANVLRRGLVDILLTAVGVLVVTGVVVAAVIAA